MVAENAHVLIDPSRGKVQEQSRTQIEEEIMKVAVNNWPKATRTLVRKFKAVEINLDMALVKINQRVDYQLRTVGDYDDYTEVLLTLLKTKKYTDLGASFALGVAIVLGKIRLIHCIMKQYPELRPNFSASHLKPGADRVFTIGMIFISMGYLNGYGLFELVYYSFSSSLPEYRWNRSLFPRKKEPSYDDWAPLS